MHARMQYADSATHYRAYLILNHKKFPKLDDIWVGLYNSIFSPRLFTTLEGEEGDTSNCGSALGTNRKDLHHRDRQGV